MVSIKCRLQAGYKICRLHEYKTLCIPQKSNLNLNIISAIIVGGINKHDWSVGVGGSSCYTLRFRERMATSVSSRSNWCITWKFQRRQISVGCCMVFSSVYLIFDNLMLHIGTEIIQPSKTRIQNLPHSSKCNSVYFFSILRKERTLTRESFLLRQM